MSDDSTNTPVAEATTAVVEAVADTAEKTVEAVVEAAPEPIKSAAIETARTAKSVTVKTARKSKAATAKAVAEPAAKAVVAQAKPARAKRVAKVKSAPAKAAVAKAKSAPAKAVVAEAKSAPAKAVAKRGPKPRVKSPAQTVGEAVSKASRKAGAAVVRRKYVRKTVAAAMPAVATQFKGFKTMTNEATNWFAGFTAVPGADKFQSLLADAGEKGQEAVKKTQFFAEQLTEAAKANVEAVVESSRIAVAGARDLGQDVVASTRGGVEQASAAVKTLADAKSPTEFFQLQSELVRSSFDRFVAEGSKFTEQLVKLTGEAIQPLSNRASVSAEKFSELSA